jgi:hypothetical protein
MAERLLGVAPGNPMFATPHLAWKYWAPWRSSASFRSYVLVRDGRIVAHAGALPLACRVGVSTLSLLHPFDWMSEPSAIGSGAALLQRLSKLADGLLIVGGSEMTRRMVLPLGFRAFPGVTLFASPVETDATASSLASKQAPTSLPSRLVAPTLEDCTGIEPPVPWLTTLRTPERIQDYLSCPAVATTVYGVHSAGRRSGGFVLTLAPGQARIAALWAARDPQHLPAVIHAARGVASRQPGITEVVCMANLPIECDALTAAGFRDVGSVPMFLLDTARCLGQGAQLSFQMLDGDVGFLHHGTPQPWL